MTDRIEIIPLGGLGEFGMNCMAVRANGEMIIIDAGMGFPEESVYGVDVAVPDFSALDDYRDEISAVILTHGHEDHIGALPYFLRRFNVPVYGSAFTIALAESRLEEHELLDQVLLHRVEARDRIELDSFEIEFIRVSHSLVDCFALAITTPAGIIVHTGDYKMDETPVIGDPVDLRTLRRYGQEGVLALLSDSTNATVPGRTPSERAVIPTFEEIFAQAPGRIIVACFASSVHRQQIVLDVAQQFGRRVCVLGRSMQKSVEIADRLGYLDIPVDLLVSLDEAKRLDGDEVVFLVTGSQSEPRSVLQQMATQSYKGISIEEGDTVVLSARIIPGHERAISRLIGEIYKRGGQIFDEKRRLVHVSGHASQEDIRLMTEAVRPRYVIPIHGEYRMLYRHKEYLRRHVGLDEERVVLVENGDVIELNAERASVIDRWAIGRVFIDETEVGFEEVDDETVRERRQLAFDGVLTPVVTINERTGALEAAPEIAAHGLVGMDGDGFVRELKRIVAETVRTASAAEKRDTTLLKERIRLELKRFIQRQTGARPVITPVIVQVGCE
ncbi:ribonuclease J [Pyrinomonas sp.]|uniref:ribonuclease J n=1 Tax=Pyrinomonas sp. TaxID=2080306 RepID=UPI00331F6280